MKKLFGLLTLFCCFSFAAFCQDYKNEIGVNLLKFNYGFNDGIGYPDIRVQVLYREYEPNSNNYLEKLRVVVSPHLFYSTRIYKNLRFRMGFQFMNTTFNVPEIQFSHFTDPPTYRKIENYFFSEGLQYNFLNSRKISPYLFGDINLNLTKYVIKTFDEQDNHLATFYYGPDYQFGITLGAGVKYKLNKRFSTSLEISENGTHGSHFLSRLSINYHF